MLVATVERVQMLPSLLTRALGRVVMSLFGTELFHRLIVLFVALILGLFMFSLVLVSRRRSTIILRLTEPNGSV